MYFYFFPYWYTYLCFYTYAEGFSSLFVCLFVCRGKELRKIMLPPICTGFLVYPSPSLSPCFARLPTVI